MYKRPAFTERAHRAGQINRRELILGLRKHPDLAALFELPGKIRLDAFMEAFFQAIDADNDDGLSLHELLQSFAETQPAEALGLEAEAPALALGLEPEPEGSAEEELAEGGSPDATAPE